MPQPEVLVFVMRGCGACHALRPIVDRVAEHYGACVATHIIDVDAHSVLADTMGVEETPTIIGVDPMRRARVRMIGFDGKPDRIAALYAKIAAEATSCSVGRFEDV